MWSVNPCDRLRYDDTPETGRGQTGGQIDKEAAILDGIGLLLFIIPGLIAYAVYFSTGAIYPPADSGEYDGAGDG